MGLNSISSAARPDNDEKTRSAVELHNLQDAPPECPVRPPMTKTQRAWEFLSTPGTVAWLLLLSIGGPILLHELAVHLLDDFTSPDNILALRQAVLPCDVQDTWTSWSALFEINLRTKSLSFTSAKIIDVVFDVVVGRGGQAYLAWVAYEVYTDILTRITENGKIRYDLFAAITLCPNELQTLGTTVASVPSAQNLWTKFMLLWTILAMLYVLAFPTMVSTATSLVAATRTSVQLIDNGTVPLDLYLETASYSFTDSGLDDKPNPWVVSVEDITYVGANDCGFLSLSHHSYGGGVSGAPGGNTIVVNQTTYEPSNITKTSCGFNYGNHFYPVNWTGEWHSMPINQLLDKQVICLPDGRNYQWGASWELLVLLLILQIMWSTSLLFIKIEAGRHSQLVQRGRKMGMWRAILDLAEPLVLRLGPGSGMYNQKELVDSVRHISNVHYEAKVEGMQDGVASQDVHLVSCVEADTISPP